MAQSNKTPLASDQNEYELTSNWDTEAIEYEQSTINQS
jgi:hypothetical protein